MLLRRFVRFVLVGGFATGIQYVVLVLLVQKGGIGPVVASAVGFVVSAFVNYIINYHYTFGSSQPHFAAMAKFSVLASAGLLLNSLIMAALVRFGLHYLGAQVAATVAVLLWNFTGNSLWTFRGTTRLTERKGKDTTGTPISRRARMKAPESGVDAPIVGTQQEPPLVAASMIPTEAANTGEPFASTRESRKDFRVRDREVERRLV